MKHGTLLTIAALLSIVLMTFHLTDDIVRGMERGGASTLFGVLILVVWLCGTLLLAERRSGLVIMLLGGLLAAGMPLIHMTGAGVGAAIAASRDGFFIIWTLFALGVSGSFASILAARGLWMLRSRTPR